MAFEFISQDSVASIAPSPEAIEVSATDPRATQARSFNDVADMRIALARQARAASVTALNQLLADSMTLRDLYKKHHWQTSGATFYQLHVLFDKHHEEQVELIDAIAERIQTLGGTAIAMAADVAVTTIITLPPMDREEPSRQLARLVDAHERVLHYARAAARRAAELGDDGTNDLLVSDVIRSNEKQAWFVQELLQRSHVSPAL
jgi:starvation-inducible DNA-binding protein